MTIRNQPRDAAVSGIDIGKTVFHVVGLDVGHPCGASAIHTWEPEGIIAEPSVRQKTSASDAAG